MTILLLFALKFLFRRFTKTQIEKQPYLLHKLAAHNTITALNHAQHLLEMGVHFTAEVMPGENVTALHVAATMDNNVAMCQLLVYFGADGEKIN